MLTQNTRGEMIVRPAYQDSIETLSPKLAQARGGHYRKNISKMVKIIAAADERFEDNGIEIAYRLDDYYEDFLTEYLPTTTTRKETRMSLTDFALTALYEGLYSRLA